MSRTSAELSYENDGVDMNCLTVKEMGEKWGVSGRRAHTAARRDG